MLMARFLLAPDFKNTAIGGRLLQELLRLFFCPSDFPFSIFIKWRSKSIQLIIVLVGFYVSVWHFQQKSKLPSFSSAHLLQTQDSIGAALVSCSSMIEEAFAKSWSLMIQSSKNIFWMPWRAPLGIVCSFFTKDSMRFSARMFFAECRTTTFSSV